jgi:hypothetical protein
MHPSLCAYSVSPTYSIWPIADNAIEPVDGAAIVPARIALSVPIVNAYPNPLSAGPVFASHPLDMQVLDTRAKSSFAAEEKEEGQSKTHTGAPTCNIEVKLLRINEEAVVGGADPEGEVSGTGLQSHMLCLIACFP